MGNYKVNKMVKSRKNNLHLEVSNGLTPFRPTSISNDVDLEYETASTTSRRSKKTNGKGKALTKTKKVSLKAKPKKKSFFPCCQWKENSSCQFKEEQKK